MKFEKIGSRYSLLESEAYLLFLLKGAGIPRIISYGNIVGFKVLVEELLGETIYSIWNKKRNNIKDKLNDICLIAIQCLNRLKFIHSKNIIHRDIKPFNFLFGKKDPNTVYLIDFGISKKYRSSRTGNHIKFGKAKKISGSCRYMSLNSNKGFEQSRRDDLESLGYMLIYLIKKSLPWINVENLKISKMEKYRKICGIKLSTLPEELCSGLPKEFCDYIKYCRNLNFEQEPNYNYLTNLFLGIIQRNERIRDLAFIRLMNFSWLKNKDIKKGKIDCFIPCYRGILSGMETDTSSKGKENTHKRLYKLVKDSIERAKSQESPKIRNNNFFKFDLKNINIILNNINSIGKNSNNKNAYKNKNNLNKKINNIFSNNRAVIKNTTKINSMNKIEKKFLTDPLEKHKVIIKNRILTGFPNININSHRDKRFNFSDLNEIKKSGFLNSIANMSIDSERKSCYKPLREREKEKIKDKAKITKNYIKNNTLSMDFNFINESCFINHTNNINNHMITDRAKVKYVNYSNKISHLIKNRIKKNKY